MEEPIGFELRHSVQVRDKKDHERTGIELHRLKCGCRVRVIEGSVVFVRQSVCYARHRVWGAVTRIFRHDGP